MSRNNMNQKIRIPIMKTANIQSKNKKTSKMSSKILKWKLLAIKVVILILMNKNK